MIGFLGLIKPPFMSSFDVIRYLRRLGVKEKMGHTGTLDNLGMGVLTLAVGKATRLVEFYMREKRYCAEITLGITTDTHDVEGKVLANRVEEIPLYTREDILKSLAGFHGEMEQVPPEHSAKKLDGHRAYELARKGVAVHLKPQRIKIHRIELLSLSNEKPQRLLVDVHCSTGTYLRGIARDLGEKIGSGATLTFLVRTYACPFSIEECATLEEIQKAGGISPFLKPPDVGLTDFPRFTLTESEKRLLLMGKKLRVGRGFSYRYYRLYSPSNEFLAIGVKQGSFLSPYKRMVS